MNRREFTVAAGMLLGTPAVLASKNRPAERLPERNVIRTAFLLGANTNMIDTAGPWEVFQDTHLSGSAGMRHPFELFAVAPTKDLVRMTGGLQVKAHYTFEDAPAADLIVVPPASIEWLRSASGKADMTMSVCTGAFQLARAGLLKGLGATTHHHSFDDFARAFPEVELRRGVRFVDNGSLATAGGLTSGIDLALHVVSRYFGAEVAKETARTMEYEGTRWMTGAQDL